MKKIFPFLFLTGALLCSASLSAEQKILEGSSDPRLPPALPGEEVSDGKRKMKLWSTSGPVPVMATPSQEEWSLPPVIVDTRDKYDRRPERQPGNLKDKQGD